MAPSVITRFGRTRPFLAFWRPVFGSTTAPAALLITLVAASPRRSTCLRAFMAYLRWSSSCRSGLDAVAVERVAPQGKPEAGALGRRQRPLDRFDHAVEQEVVGAHVVREVLEVA